MKMVKLVCPYCGATLSIENGIDTFYCQYCGGKILLQGQDKNSIDAKVKLKEFEHKERLQHNQHIFQEQIQKRNQDFELEKRNNRSYHIRRIFEYIFAIFVVIILGIVLIIGLLH